MWSPLLYDGDQYICGFKGKVSVPGRLPQFFFFIPFQIFFSKNLQTDLQPNLWVVLYIVWNIIILWKFFIESARASSYCFVFVDRLLLQCKVSMLTSGYDVTRSIVAKIRGHKSMIGSDQFTLKAYDIGYIPDSHLKI